MMENLGRMGPIHFEDGLLTAAGFGRGAVPLSVVAFSVGPEVELCGAPGGVSSSGIHLDTFVAGDAGAAAGGGPRRGVLLSGAPAGTRYLGLGSFAGQPSPVGSLLGVPGLCLAPGFVRVDFGATGGPNDLCFAGPPELGTASERFLTTAGTVHLQALGFPPPGAGVPRWSNAVTLEID